MTGAKARLSQVQRVKDLAILSSPVVEYDQLQASERLEKPRVSEAADPLDVLLGQNSRASSSTRFSFVCRCALDFLLVGFALRHYRSRQSTDTTDDLNCLKGGIRVSNMARQKSETSRSCEHIGVAQGDVCELLRAWDCFS